MLSDEIHPICKRCIKDYQSKMKELSVVEPDGSVKWKINCSYIFKEDLNTDKILEKAEEESLSDIDKLEAVYKANFTEFSRNVFSINPYEYQEELGLCTSNRIVCRMARRLGKTVGMDLKIIHFAFFNPNQRIIVFAPFKRQVEKLFSDVEKIIKRGGDYAVGKVNPVVNSSRLFKKNPLEMNFTNGTTMVGISVGVSTNDKSMALRGDGVKDFDEAAGIMVGDEVDFLPQKSWEVLGPMIMESDEIAYYSSSTPIGKREQFYKTCRGSLAPKYKEIYRTIYDKPGVTEEFIEEARSMCGSQDVFDREYLALFGEEISVEFSYEDLMQCQWKRIKYPDIPLTQDDHPDYEKVSYVTPEHFGSHPDSIRTIGIDWNGDKIGTRFVVIEYDQSANKYKIIGRYAIDAGKYKQLAAIDMVRALNRMFLPKFIFADEGYGKTEFQRLHQIAHQGPSLPDFHEADKNLVNVIPIAMQGNTEMYDYNTKKITKKRNKPLMIEIAKGLIEQHSLLIPKQEFDLNPRSFSSLKNNQVRENLIPCLLKFKRKLKDGPPAWSEDDDHDAIALSLSLMAFVIRLSEFCKRPSAFASVVAAGDLSQQAQTGSIKAALQHVQKDLKGSNRSLDIGEDDEKDFEAEETDPSKSERSIKSVSFFTRSGRRSIGSGGRGFLRTGSRKL